MSDSQPRVVVVGAGYAGVLAAVRAAKLVRGNAQITLISERATFIERVRLHEAAVCGREVHHPLDRLLNGTGVELVVGTVRRVERSQHAVLLVDGSRVPYDKLLLAVGSTPNRPIAGGLTVDASDLVSLRQKLIGLRGGATVAVLGAGLLGIETAAEIKTAMPRLDVVLAGKKLGGPFDDQGREMCRTALSDMGVRLLLHPQGGRVDAGVLHVGSQQLRADALLTATGMRAAMIVERSGFMVNARGQGLVDECLRSVEDPDIYLVGDCAAFVAPGDVRIDMGCKYAMPMAHLAAQNAIAALSRKPEQALRFKDTHYIARLGARAGIVQLNEPRLHFDGRPASWVREKVVSSALNALRWERHWWFSYPYARLPDGRAPVQRTSEHTANG